MMLKADSAFLAGNDRFEGYLADILKRLAAYVGFEYDIRLSRDGKHGDLRMDRIWDGMLGDLQRGVSFILLRAIKLKVKHPVFTWRSFERIKQNPFTTLTCYKWERKKGYGAVINGRCHLCN
jgi:hypothetical protein